MMDGWQWPIRMIGETTIAYGNREGRWACHEILRFEKWRVIVIVKSAIAVLQSMEARSLLLKYGSMEHDKTVDNWLDIQLKREARRSDTLEECDYAKVAWGVAATWVAMALHEKWPEIMKRAGEIAEREIAETAAGLASPPGASA